jgi:beta-galactosidase
MTVRYCTSVHYWRTPSASWDRVLDRLAAAGIQGIDAYVPWSVHEVEEGRFDFGRDDPQLDLPGFLGKVRDRGMWVLLRPGPQVNAELNNFGLPDRIVRDAEVQAQGPRGRAVFCAAPPVFFPVPSYASPRYHDEVRGWFSALGEAIVPVLSESDPVRLVQVDNETALFFREAPFDQDYRPEALALWRAWQRDEGLDVGDAPLSREAGLEGLRRAMAWVRFRQWMMTRCLGIFRQALVDAGLGSAPFSHNMPPSGLWQPLRHEPLSRVVDVVATDVYSTAKGFASARDQVLRLRGSEDEPFAAEMGCGTVFFAPAITASDNRYVTCACLAHGLKGFNLYMGAGRDRWIGGLVPEGGEREGADLLHFYQRLIRLLGTIGLGDLRPVSAAALVVPDAYLDHSLAAFPLPAGSPALFAGLHLPVHEMLVRDEWGLGRPVQVEWIERLRECESALVGASLPYHMVGGTLPVARDLLLVVPTFRYLARDVLAALLDHLEAGSRRRVARAARPGPRRARKERGWPDSRLLHAGPRGPGSPDQGLARAGRAAPLRGPGPASHGPPPAPPGRDGRPVGHVGRDASGRARREPRARAPARVRLDEAAGGAGEGHGLRPGVGARPAHA